MAFPREIFAKLNCGYGVTTLSAAWEGLGILETKVYHPT
jgi:hypothetical protein